MQLRVPFLLLPLFSALACDSPTVVDPLASVAHAPGPPITTKSLTSPARGPIEDEADPWPYPWASPADPFVLAGQRLDEQLARIEQLDPEARVGLESAARNLARRSLVHRSLIALTFDVDRGLTSIETGVLDEAGLSPLERERFEALRESIALQARVLIAMGFEPDVSVGEDEDAEFEEDRIVELAPGFPYSDELKHWQSEMDVLRATASSPCDGCSKAAATARSSLDDALTALLERAAEVPDLGC